MPSSSFSSSEAEASMIPKVSKDLAPEYATNVVGFFEGVGVSDAAVDDFASNNAYSVVLWHNLKPLFVERGRVSCFLSVKPAIANFYNGLHGGAIAAVAERVSVACARTLVSEDKELFLGELSISYLSAAPLNAELIVDGYVVRSGRNLTTITIEFKIKGSGKLVYIARATSYNFPMSKL